MTKPPRPTDARALHRALPLLSPVLAVGLALLALTGCSGDSAGSAGPGTEGTVPVVASFYPLQFVAERVGGDHVDVTSLTKPGLEPHDLELAPQDVATVAEAAQDGLVLYLSGFQPAVDEAVAGAAGGDRVLDVADAANLDLEAPEGGEEAGGVDPHFWLDPTRLADVVTEVEDRLSTIDPDNAADYAGNAGELRAALTNLDRQFRQGLSECRSRDLVTSHTAFGYLAQRYDLVQRGIVGLNPEAEPNPAELADVAAFVRANDVTTIFFETLVSPAVAETVARETGARTALLDPIEGLTTDDPGASYLTVMKDNLAALQRGLGCTA